MPWILIPGFSSILLDGIADFDGYLDELMGQPDKDGKLALWFREAIKFYGLPQFKKKGIQPQEFLRIFERHWTQYWPHEHLDFPPWPPGKAPGDRAVSSETKHACRGTSSGAKRRVLTYLEDQMVYISDLLSKIELEWAKITPAPDNLQSRHELLARFGHACHAIEDFFFHSNFIEFAWKQHRGDLPSGASKLEKRIFHRRMRSPVSDDGKVFSTTGSEPSLVVFTGYFFEHDIFHTVMDFAGPLVARLNEKLTLAGPAGANSAAIGRFRQRAERFKRIIDGTQEEKEKDLEEHRKDLKPQDSLGGRSYWQADGEDLRQLVGDHPESVKAWTEMGKLDWQLGEDYSTIGLGIFGFLQQLGDQAGAESKTATTKSEELNAAGTGGKAYDATDNGSSKENIGSHTLMAKDSERKRPLRDPAINLATCTGLYVAETMLRSMNTNYLAAARSEPGADSQSARNTRDSVRFVDWLHLLQHFVCHPQESVKDGQSNFWWVAALDDKNAGTYHTVRYITRAEAKRRAREEMKEKLEEDYRKSAQMFEADWRNTVSADFWTDLAVVGLVVAAGVVGAVLGARKGGASGAVLGALAGVGGAVAGAMLGRAAGGNAGALAGGLAGAAAGVTAAHFIGKAFGR